MGAGQLCALAHNWKTAVELDPFVKNATADSGVGGEPAESLGGVVGPIAMDEDVFVDQPADIVKHQEPGVLDLHAAGEEFRPHPPKQVRVGMGHRQDSCCGEIQIRWALGRHA